MIKYNSAKVKSFSNQKYYKDYLNRFSNNTPIKKNKQIPSYFNFATLDKFPLNVPTYKNL